MPSTHRNDRNRDKHHITSGPIKFSGAPDLLFKQKEASRKRMRKRCSALARAKTPKPKGVPLRCTGLFKYAMQPAWFVRRWELKAPA